MKTKRAKPLLYAKAVIPLGVGLLSILTLLVLTAVSVLRGDILSAVLAILVIGALSFFLVLARRLQTATRTMGKHRAEKDALIAQLERAKAISDGSRQRAEEANLAKSRFLATMSHELRTPLNAILGFSEIMENEVLGPMHNVRYREYAANVHESGQHLLTLINEILDLSRIEAGHHDLHEEPVDLAAVTAECCQMIKLKAHSKEIRISETYDRALPDLWADDRALRQVALNLLSNAIKFTPPRGEIVVVVSATPDGGQTFSVRDNGPGIPAEEMPIALSSFGQGSIASRSAERGAGLGLPIAQALIHLHDGDFDIQSAPQRGTKVTVAFPPSRTMDSAPAPNEKADETIEWLRAS